MSEVSSYYLYNSHFQIFLCMLHHCLYDNISALSCLWKPHWWQATSSWMYGQNCCDCPPGVFSFWLGSSLFCAEAKRACASNYTSCRATSLSPHLWTKVRFVWQHLLNYLGTSRVPVLGTRGKNISFSTTKLAFMIHIICSQCNPAILPASCSAQPVMGTCSLPITGGSIFCYLTIPSMPDLTVSSKDKK